MCFALKVLRPVAIQPVWPSHTGCRMRPRGRPLRSTVVTVHQTMREVMAWKSGAMVSQSTFMLTPLPNGWPMLSGGRAMIWAIAGWRNRGSPGWRARRWLTQVNLHVGGGQPFAELVAGVGKFAYRAEAVF